MPEFIFGPTPHTEAIDFLKSKPIVSKQVFNQMAPELKARVFTISGVEDMGVVQAIRDRIADLPAGVPWDEAKKDLVKNLHPWLDDEESGTKRSEARAELLLRTHGFQAYSAAAERVMRLAKGTDSYTVYVPVVRSTNRNASQPVGSYCGHQVDPPDGLQIDGYVYVQTADRYTHDRTWTETQEWTGFDAIDPILYPSAD